MRRSALLAAALLFAAPPLPLAAQAKVLLQVREPDESPVREVRLTYGGVRSLPTNAEGATELHLPPNHPVGLPIKLLLVVNPKKDWFLINPTINVPAEGFPAELVVMSRREFRRLSDEVLKAKSLERSSLQSSGQEGPALRELAVRYHLKPEQIEEAIRSFGDTKSPLDQGIAKYLAGQYAQAEELLRSASAKAERDFVEAQRYLASSLLAQKKYAEAVRELRRAVAVQPENIDLLNELGWYLAFMVHDWKEAEVVQRTVLVLVERKHGPADDRTAQALRRLAIALERSNRREEAERLDWRILRIAEANHGLDHPDVASALENLARHFELRACPQEALAFYRRALRIRESHLEVSDMQLQMSLESTARLLSSLERPREALELLQRALPRTEWRIGPNRPFQQGQSRFGVPTSQILKGEVLVQLNRLEEAEALLRSLVSLFEDHLRPDHPATTDALNRLAQLLHFTNRLGEAESLIRRALVLDRKGTDPGGRVARDLNHLGGVLLTASCLPEAEAALLEALDLLRARSLEMQSLTPGTDLALERYERVLRKLGRPEEAIQARLAELRQGLPPAVPLPLCTPPPD